MSKNVKNLLLSSCTELNNLVQHCLVTLYSLPTNTIQFTTFSFMTLKEGDCPSPFP